MRETRECSDCAEVKGLHLFEGGRAKCRKCKNKERRESPNKHQYDINARAAKRGVSLEEYTFNLESSTTCEICGDSTSLVYDHNHETNTFRGILCSMCNSALGKFKDSPTVLAKAAKYLQDRGHYSSYCREV